MSKIIPTVDVQVCAGPDENGITQWTTVGTLTRLIGLSFEFLSNGWYGSATVSAQQLFNEDGFLALQIKATKRLVIKLNGSAVFVALLRRPVRAWNALQVHNIQAVGPVDDMNKTLVRRTYAPPGGKADLSWFYQQLFNDYISPRGYARQSSVEVLGVNQQSITYNGNLRQALNDLGTLASDFVYWGLQLTDDGDIEFFVRKRDPDADPIYSANIDTANFPYDPTTDATPPVVDSMDHTEEDLELVNRIFLDGGTLFYPNVAFNPSFENVKQGDSGASDLLQNGDFESLVGYQLLNGASRKSLSQYPPVSPTHYIELDHETEEIVWSVVGLQANARYALSFYMMVEVPIIGGNACTYFTTGSVKWFRNSADLTILSHDELEFQNVGQPWIEWTLHTQAPPNATYAIVEIGFPRAIVTSGGAPQSLSNGKGVLIDNASFYSEDQIYQSGWRIETTAAPSGNDSNANPNGLYLVNWLYDYAKPDAVSPGQEYGNYAVNVNAFGKSGGNYVRLINSPEGQISADPNQFYTLAINARALEQDGAAPDTGTPNLRLGIVWWKDATHIGGTITKDVTVTDACKIYGGQFKVPADSSFIRAYFELLEPLNYFLDGVQLSKNPTTPDFFTLDNTFHKIVDVKDCYDSGDPRYGSSDDPPDGYGPIEEAVQNASILTTEDAIRYCKQIFDVRALPQTSESTVIRQIDYPVTLYKPDGYFQMTAVGDLAAFGFPKLWPMRVSYNWEESGLVAEVELDKELPRTDQLLNIRSLVITAAGAGEGNLYVEPISVDYTVIASDPKVSGAGKILTYTFDASPDMNTMEAAIRGFDVPPSWMSVDLGDPKTVVVTIPTADPTDIYNVGDQIAFWFAPQAEGGILNLTKRVSYVATSGGSEVFILPTDIATGQPEVPLPGSWRGYVREQRLPDNLLVVLVNPASGDGDRFSVDPSVDLNVGDKVEVRYFSTDRTLRPELVYEGIVPAGGLATDVALPRYEFTNDGGGNFAWGAWLAGLLKQEDEATYAAHGDGLFDVQFPADSVGSYYLIRYNPA